MLEQYVRSTVPAQHLHVQSHEIVHPREVRVVHQLPQRLRLRPRMGRWSDAQRMRLARALDRMAEVRSFRFTSCGHSLTIQHAGPAHDVIDSVHHALATCGAGMREQIAHPRPGTVRSPRSRKAARRLLVCAVVSLAIALMPQPMVPSMIVLRLLACGIAAAVRYQAQTQADPCRLTRFLDTLANAVSIARAGNWLLALLQNWAQAVLKQWLQARLEQAFPPRAAVVLA